MKQKILLTGGKGFILSSFYNRYKEDYEIIRTGRNAKVLVPLDVRDEGQVKKVIQAYKPDVVLHGAGITSTQGCENNKTLAYEVNVKGTIHVAKACQSVGAKVIFFSTEQVFNGNQEKGPYAEEMKAVPNTYYGVTKLAAEEAIRDILDDYIIMRLTWMYGFSKDPSVRNILTDTMYSKGVIKVPDNEFRGMTPVASLLDFFPKIMNLPKGTYHIGSENNKTRYQIVKEILGQINKKDVEVIINNHKATRDIRLSMEKINALGIVFEPTDQAIKKTIQKNKVAIEESI